MPKGRLRYGLKLGGVMMHKGTLVTILLPDDPLVQESWPNIETRPSSKYMAVKFDHLQHPTVMHVSEVEVCND